MEAKWLEDFIALADTQSFTAAAERVHCSQSALSRRIRSLEEWVGSELIDRDAYPLRLTGAGQRFYTVAIGLRGSLEAARQIARRDASSPAEPLRVQVLPDLHPSIAARLLTPEMGVPGMGAPVEQRTQIHAAPLDQSLASLAEGSADLLLLHQHARLPMVMDPLRFESVAIELDSFSLYCSRSLRRPGTGGEATLPFISHAPACYLAQVEALLLSSPREQARVRVVCEADTPAAVLAMVRAGIGIGFVPGSWLGADAAEQDIAPLGPPWEATLQVCAVRATRTSRRTSDAQRRRTVDALWSRLLCRSSELGHRSSFGQRASMRNWAPGPVPQVSHS